MRTINIGDDVHEQVSKIVKDNPFKYPTIQFYVNEAVKEKLRSDTPVV